MSVRIVIPARLNSQRLPGKPMEMIGSQSLLEHVHARASEIGFPITVLTDHRDLSRAYPGMDIRVTPRADNGTARVALMAEQFEEDILVNCQGDLPFIKPHQILQAVLATSFGTVGTLICPLTKPDDPNTVKAICSRIDNQFHRVHWCGRGSYSYGYQHVGVYAFRREDLIDNWPLKSTAHERIEGLEQLRWLENGYRITACLIDGPVLEVNTPEDLEEARRHHG